MKPERWQQIDKLWDEILDCPEDEREALIDRVCADDEDMRIEIESLFKVSKESESFMEKPALRFAAKSYAADERKR